MEKKDTKHQKIEQIIPSKKRPKPHFLITTGKDNGRPVICKDKASGREIELYHVPFNVLVTLNTWIETVTDLNGGHGEFTLQLKGGLFKSATATETFRFISESDEALPDSTP